MSKKMIVFTSMLTTLVTAGLLFALFHAANADLLAQVGSQAGAPGLITYQGYLSDGTGNPMPDDSYALRFELCATASCTTVLWSETHSSVAVQKGYFTVLLGSSSALVASHFGGAERWLRVSVQGPADAGYTTFAAQRVASAPYAFQAVEAQNADTLDGTDSSGFAAVQHHHWGQNWQGASASSGLVLTNTGTGYGLSGQSSASIGVYGLGGQASGHTPIGAVGVWGDSSDSHGVVGSTSDNNAAGVFGVAQETTMGNAYGVYGWSKSPDGAGVYGLANAGVGVWGRSDDGAGGYFDSSNGHALVINGPSLSKSLTPEQIGMLRWYAAISTTQPISFSVGHSPEGVAFDGDHIWVANYGHDNVTKLRASDGAVLGTYSVGMGPRGICFDGGYIWVANYAAWTVSKLRASDGVSVGTFPVTGYPVDVLFDGTNIWVSTDWGWLSKLRPSDGQVLATYSLANTHHLAFDGENIWVSQYDSHTVSKVRASDGQLLSTVSVSGPWGLCFDGAHIWVAANGGAAVVKIRASDAVVLDTFSGSFIQPVGVAFDGGYIWVADYNLDKLFKLDAQDGHIVASVSVHVGNFGGMAFDGTHMWLETRDDTVSKH